MKSSLRFGALIIYWFFLTRILICENPWAVLSRDLAEAPPFDVSFEPLSWVTHFLAFAVLGVLIRISTENHPRLRKALYAFAFFYAGATEALQYFIPNRWPGVLDFAFNCLGTAATRRRWTRPVSLAKLLG